MWHQVGCRRGAPTAPADNGTIGADRVQEKKEIVNLDLEISECRSPVREPGGAPIVSDHPEREAQLLEEVADERLFRHDLKVAREAGDPDEIDGSAAPDLVGNRDRILRLYITGLAHPIGSDSRLVRRRFSRPG